MISCLTLEMSRTISAERPSKMSSSRRSSLLPIFAQHRERGVDAVVDDLVEQVARALGEQLLADVLARAAALEEVLDRLAAARWAA